MTAALVLTLIFGVFYPLVTLAVWCLGAFGIAVTMSEVRAAVADRLRREHSYIAEWQTRWDTNSILWQRILLTFAVGALWPVGIPLWFAWRNGTHIDAELEKRDALSLVKDAAS